MSPTAVKKRPSLLTEQWLMGVLTGGRIEVRCLRLMGADGVD